MSEYLDHLKQMSRIHRQTKAALINSRIDMAQQLALMYFNESRLLLQCVNEMKREIDSRKALET